MAGVSVKQGVKVRARNAGNATEPKGASSTTRVLGVLDLFTIERPVWTAEALIEELALSRPTVYRYLRALGEAGFVVPATRGGYVLGPRFIEMDRQIRIADPLIHLGMPILAKDRDAIDGMQMLCSFYGSKVLTVFRDRVDPAIDASMERGRPFSLLRGAPSKIILAHLPVYHLKNLYLSDSRTIGKLGLGQNWHAFRDHLRDIKSRGYYVGSEIDKALVGIAAPIFSSSGDIIASYCLVRTKDKIGSDLELLIDMAVATGKAISAALQSDSGTDSDDRQAAFPTARLGRAS